MEEIVLTNPEQMGISDHALGKFTRRFSFPGPRNAEETLRRFLAKAKWVGAQKEGLLFQSEGWEFVVNCDLTVVITCYRQGGRKKQIKPKTRHLRSREKRELLRLTAKI